MNSKYSLFSMPESKMEVEEFINYLLKKDTIITLDSGKIICAPSLNEKIHSDIKAIQNSYLYRYNGKVYFIFSEYYKKVWQVRILFDTTAYITAQIIILKISLIFISLSGIFYIFFGNKITRKCLTGLKNIAEKAKNISLEKPNTAFEINWPANDEIRILSETLNRMLEKIEKQTSNLKQFTTDVSHEFKTPLMVMSSHLDLIEKKHPKEVSQEITSSFKKSIWKLNTLIETLLFLARIEENTENLEFQDIPVKKFFAHRSEEIKKAFWEKSISFTYKISEKLTYKVDEVTFQILIDNIITNACKFSKSPVKIEIIADKNGFSIQDNWNGLNEEEIKKIYEKFYRANKQIEWFWVGFFLVKRITELYEWSIHIESRKWQGTKCSIHIL